MLDKILDSLDESIFNSETKQGIRESFEDAVNARAEFIVEEKVEELEQQKQTLQEELQAKIEELEAKDAGREEDFEKRIDELEAKAQEYNEELMKKAEEFVELKESEMLDQVDQYLDRIVSEFVEDAKQSLQESTKVKESELIKEAFEAMVKSTGAEFQKSILESAEESIRSEIETLKESYNDAIKEVFELKRENQELLRIGLVNEMAEGLTLVEAERFKRLVEGIQFTQDDKYVSRLESIKESVKGLETKKEEILTETVVPEQKVQVLNSEREFGNLFQFKHLL